ncbi:MAG: hypothetical protein JWN02_1969 [Acidobacteria bacterium]|nr:hypothetical protein [Acidobacteriota bacterium]
MKTALLLTLTVALSSPLAADDGHAGCPMHAQHMAKAAATSHAGHDTAHAADVEKRGDRVMGFSHEATQHTFRATGNGGVIEVRADAADDAGSIGMIREHLQQIAADFASGDFAKPEAIHGRLPDGAETMRASGAAIRYQYEELPDGARVRITGLTPKALEAVHAFLSFQIDEHGAETDGNRAGAARISNQAPPRDHSATPAVQGMAGCAGHAQ